MPEEDFREHYASLSEEGLREINRADLTDVARACYDQELASRGLSMETMPETVEPFNDDIDWEPLGTFQAEEIDVARALLETEGIPTDADPRPSENYPPVTAGLVLYVPGKYFDRAREVMAATVSEEELIAEAEAEERPE